MNKVIELEKRTRQPSTDINDYTKLKESYFGHGKYEKLLDLLSQRTSLNLPAFELAKIYYEKGEVLQQLNRVDEAIVSFKKSLKLVRHEEDSFDFLFLVAMSHYNLFLLLHDQDKSYRHAEDAKKCFILLTKQALSDEQKYLSYSHLADIHAQTGEYEKALYFYDVALETNPDNRDLVWALVGIACTYGKKKELDKAAQYFDEALRKANRAVPTSKIYYEYGKMYFEGNFLSRAGQAFQKALKYKNNDPTLKANQEYEIDILWHLGTIAYEENDYDNVVPYLNRVLHTIDDKHYYFANTHLTLGHYYLMMEDRRKAREHYSHVIVARRAADEEVKIAKECLAQISLDA